MSRKIKNTDVEVKFPWPDDCFIQGGESGVVICQTKDNYMTAFVEAFPTDPSTFIRGEGETVEEAEESAWLKYEKYTACDGHEFERREYKNGAGFCKHCGMFKSKAFEPLTKCFKCGTPTYHFSDNEGEFWCEDHCAECPDDRLNEWQLKWKAEKLKEKEEQP